MVNLPVIGVVVVLAFIGIMTYVGYLAGSLRPRLQGRQPCRRWFVWLMGTLAAAVVFMTWVGLNGLGQAGPGPRGAAFGLYAGLVWGGFLSYIDSRIIWRAFDSPIADSSIQKDIAFDPDIQGEMMNTDIGVLLSQVVRRVSSFRPVPELAATGVLPWSLFVAVILLNILWAICYCGLVQLTEGAPGVKPVLSLNP